MVHASTILVMERIRADGTSLLVYYCSWIEKQPRGSEQEGEKEQKRQHCHRCNNNKAADSCAVHHCKTD